MKRLITLILALMLPVLPALAESGHEAHIFSPEDSGIALTMNDEWFHALGSNLYATYDRATSDPCEYSDLFFIYVDEIYSEGLLLFSLSNRIEGSELLLWHYDAASFPEDLAATLMLPIDRLLANPGDVVISEPVPMPAAVGFDGIYGINAVDQTPVGPEILAGKKLTMINVWATYCNPCIAEMPELAQLNADYADKGFQIIGVLSDVGDSGAFDAETLEYGNAIIDSTGADYLHLVPGEGMFYGALNSITAVPTTYFVDENGQLVGEPYVGGRDYDGWAAIVDDLLASME